MKIFNQILLFILIAVIAIDKSYSAKITSYSVISQSYYNENPNNPTETGCNAVFDLTVTYEYGLNIIFSSIISDEANLVLLSSNTIVSNTTLSIFRLTSRIKVLGLVTATFTGKYNTNSNSKIKNDIGITCQLPPTPTDLHITVPNNQTIPINRKGQSSFDVAIVVGQPPTDSLHFIIKNEASSPFSLSYDQFSNEEFILKFKLEYPTQVTDNPSIEIEPQSIGGSSITSYKTFFVYPLIKKSLNSNFINGAIYPTSSSTIESKEVFAYSTFQALSDDRESIPTFFDGLGSMSIAFPVGSSSSNSNSNFLAIIKPIRSSSYSNLTLLLTNENLVISEFKPWIESKTLTFDNNNSPIIIGNYYFSKLSWTDTTGLPIDYRIDTLSKGVEQQKYIPYWCIESFNSANYQTTFSHSLMVPNGFETSTFTSMDVMFFNKTSHFSYASLPNSINSQPPIITDILLKSSSKVLGFSITSDQTFSHLIINDKIMTAINIVNGNLKNGYFELSNINNSFIKSMSKSFKIKVCNILYSCSEFEYDSTNYSQFPSLSLPQYQKLTFSDIKSINFLKNEINTTNSIVENSIYLDSDSINSLQADTILFKLDYNSDFKPFGWNSQLGVFQCNFSVPANYYSGLIFYSILFDDYEYSYSSLFSLFGSNSTLRVSSTTSDMMPPIVASVTSKPSSTIVLSSSNYQQNEFGWDIVIEEGVNGFDHGEFNITSKFDTIGYRFKFNQSDLVNGNLLRIRIKQPDIVCLTQEYSITSAYLVDKQGYKTSKSSSSQSISALFKVSMSNQLTINVQCPDNNGSGYNSTNIDTIPPYLSSFSINSNISYMNIQNQVLSITFQIKDNESGLSTRHHPTIYLEDTLGNIILGTVGGGGMVVLASDSHTRSYKCNITLPFGFGFPGGASVSIYGIVDKFMNAKGYSPTSLKQIVDIINGGDTSKFNPIVDTPYNETSPLAPYIPQPVYNAQSKTLQFVIYGSFIGLKPSDIVVTVSKKKSTTPNPTTIRNLLSNSDDSVDGDFPYTVVEMTDSKVVLNVDITDAADDVDAESLDVSFLIGDQSPILYNIENPAIITTSGATSVITSTSQTTGTTSQTTGATSQTSSQTTGTSSQTTGTTNGAPTSATGDSTTSTSISTATSTPTSTTSGDSTTSTSTPTSTTSGGSQTTSTSTPTSTTSGDSTTSTTTSTSTTTTSGSSSTSETTSSASPSSSSSSLPDCSSLSNCGGSSQGNCVADNTCSCINSWIGSDCTSKPLEGVSINVNPNAPSASLDQDDGSGFKLSSLINLYQIREISSISNKVLYQYDLQDKWVAVKQPSPTPNTFIYSNTLTNAKSSVIYATIAIYDKQSTFEFAGEQYSINPNSIKFTINITNYKVENVLNNLELIMQAQLNSSQTDDICSKKENTTTDNSDQLTIQLNNKSLYCRFLNSALLDGVTVVNNLTHVNLNSEFQALVKPNSGQYFYGIILPVFENFVLIDPDFSLLLQSNSVSSEDGGLCTGGGASERKLNGGQIAGIVIGGVAFVAISGIAISTFVFRTHRFSSMTMSIRSWNAKRRHSKSFKLKNFQT
ncbi:hypothetical protein ACTFIV_008405 [Dictyostelium citrinum]